MIDFIFLGDSLTFGYGVKPKDNWVHKLSEYLKLNDRNFQKVKNVHDSFCEEMLIASKTNNLAERDSIIQNSIENEVRNMKNVLSNKQYKKFIKIFNATLNNQGFSTNADFSE